MIQNPLLSLSLFLNQFPDPLPITIRIDNSQQFFINVRNNISFIFIDFNDREATLNDNVGDIVCYLHEVRQEGKSPKLQDSY